MTDTVEEIAGPVAYREFGNAADAHRPALERWLLALPNLDDEEFRAEAASAIHGSALVSSFRGNWEHEHCKASAAYHEAERRHVAAGHAEDCGGDTIYDLAFGDAWRSQGHDPDQYPPKDCTCGRGTR